MNKLCNIVNFDLHMWYGHPRLEMNCLKGVSLKFDSTFDTVCSVLQLTNCSSWLGLETCSLSLRYLSFAKPADSLNT